LIKGVVEHLIPNGISHIQYADDTVLMIDGSDNSITNLKVILYCFEWLSGLKINYHKSEVILFGYSQEEKERKANMLNCRLGELPMKYLGIPVSDSVLGMGAFQGILNKMIKRLDPWKGKYMTSGGKLILTNTCLSSLPMYVMGFYFLPKGLHAKMDTIRSKFFWRGADDIFKYHMAKWMAVCRPRDHGGLGIINTEIMNQCLLTKWIWKIEIGSDELWCKLLKAKYIHAGNFFCSNQKGSSQFWKGLHKVKHLFKWGAEYKVYRGDRVRFWHDSWVGNMPLKTQFAALYEINENQHDLVCDIWDGEEWGLTFRRRLQGTWFEEWVGLQQILEGVHFDCTKEDSVKWVVDKSNHFTTKSLYYIITHGGVRDRLCGLIWKSKIPLKVKVFLWQMYHDKLQAAVTLKRRGWQGSPLCCVCNEHETVNHIFFECCFSQYLWCCIRDAFGWHDFPTSKQNFLYGWLPRRLGVPQRIVLIFFAALSWAIWKNRNSMAIQKIFPANPNLVLYNTINLLQMWRELMKDPDKIYLSEMVEILGS
jgi:hypothetical protein